MRVIITDTVFILNHDNPALEVFKDVLLVVCLEGKAVTDKYECFVSPYKQEWKTIKLEWMTRDTKHWNLWLMI